MSFEFFESEYSSLGLLDCKLATMASVKMKTVLFCGMFTFLFVEIRSGNSPNATAIPVPSVQPTTTEAASSKTEGIMSTTPSYPHVALSPNSTDKTRTTSEKLFAHSVAGTEKRSTLKETSSISTTALQNTTTTKAPTSTFGQQPTTNNFTGASGLSGKNLTTMSKTTAFSLVLKHLSAMTTSFTPTAKPSSRESTTFMPSENSTGSVQATTASVKESTLPATTVKNGQNITNKDFNQSAGTTQQPASNVTATSGSAFATDIKTTKNVQNFSATSEYTVKNQTTTGPSIHTTVFSDISTTVAGIPSTNISILATTNVTHGGLIPVATEISTTTTPNPTKVTTTTQNTTQCSSRDVQKLCLIVIAILAVVATVFIISTTVLCTKLSSRKYKLKRQHQRGTEMMCISSLLPDRSNHQPVRYTRQRSPVRNGVLVIHNCDDSDDEAGDNVTLSSFLPENDRYV